MELEIVKEKKYSYEPKEPYKILNGLGYRKRYKGMSLETLFFKDYGFLYDLIPFAQSLAVGSIFREHLLWLFAASEVFPLSEPPCGATGCKEKGTVISLRHSQDHQIACSMAYVYCREHFNGAKARSPFCSELPWKISSMRYLPKDQNLIAHHIAESWKLKHLTAEKIFWRFKYYLPERITTIRVLSEVKQREIKERRDRMNLRKKDSQLSFF